MSKNLRDQPFKKHFPSESKAPKEGYNYPTYQHYYDKKSLDPAPRTPPKASQKQQNFQSPVPPKKSSQVKNINSGINLRTELENLKQQVRKVIEKKQGVMRSPIDKRHSTVQRSQHTEITQPSLDDSDSQSVTSQKLFGQLKKAQLKKTLEGFDHSKYIQLQNNLLKTDLRNLKNKYVSKKKQLLQRCQGLQKKVAYLENGLFRSQQTLTQEVTALKQALKEAQSSQKSQLIVPTSDKAETTENDQQISQILEQKIKELYQQLSLKIKEISQKEDMIEQLSSSNRKIRKDFSQLQEKHSTIIKQFQSLKLNYQKSNIWLSQQRNKRAALERQVEQLQSIPYYTAQSSDIIDYKQEIQTLTQQLTQVKDHQSKKQGQLIIVKQELKFYKEHSEQLKTRVENLQQKIQIDAIQIQQLQQNFVKSIQSSERRHQQFIQTLQQQFHSKLVALSPKKNSIDRDQLSSPSKSIHTTKQHDNNERDLKKWKIQYKILKERHQSYMKNDQQSKTQLKEYYKNYRQCKQKMEMLMQKTKLLEKQSEKLGKSLFQRDSDLLKKEIELRKISNQAALQKGNYNRELISLRDKCKLLEQKISEQNQRCQKQIVYRKELQQKALSSGTNDETLKEVIERMKKRLNQQDEKISKNVKETKNKQTLINKLKQQLRELMESSQQQESKKQICQIESILKSHMQNELKTCSLLEQKLQSQRQMFNDLQSKLIIEIQAFKLDNNQLNSTVIKLQNELKVISHSYNNKIIQIDTLLEDKDICISDLKQQIQELQITSSSSYNLLRQEINSKNQEITMLRKEMFSRNTAVSLPQSATFDEVLRTQIQGNNKLRQDAAKKAEQIYKLRDNYTTLKSQHDNLKSENDLNKLKFLSQKKNIQIAFEVQIQNYKSVIDSWEKKVYSLEQKIQILIQENKKKDQFIQNFIIGKKISQNQKEILADFMKQYEVSISSKDIMQKLTTQSKIIEQLQKSNYALLSELSQLKEKLLLFQIIDQDKISLYESKISRRSIQSKQNLQDIYFQSESRLKKVVSLQDFTMIEKEI